jgi:hypothetical protein
MDETERDIARIYTQLISYLDPDPARSDQALRAIQRLLSGSENEPGKGRRNSSNPENPVI